MKLLIAKDLNLLKGIFLMGKMSKFLVIGQDFPPSLGFLIKVQRKGREESTPEGCNNFLTFFVRRDIPGIIILRDNPAGRCFVLKDLVLMELFQITHNCVTELMLDADFLLKCV